jgi:thiol-disulfide isomerase/thioredoxin
MTLKKTILGIVTSGIVGFSLLSQVAYAAGDQPASSAPLEQSMILLTETGEPESKQKLSDYRGEVVVVQFWATYCGFCKANFPRLAAVSERFNDQGVKVIAVSTDRDGDTLVSYIQNEHPGVTIAWDISDKLSTAYEVSSIPHTYVLDKNGNVIHQQIGAYSQADVDVLESKIRAAIGS